MKHGCAQCVISVFVHFSLELTRMLLTMKATVPLADKCHQNTGKLLTSDCYRHCYYFFFFATLVYPLMKPSSSLDWRSFLGINSFVGYDQFWGGYTFGLLVSWCFQGFCWFIFPFFLDQTKTTHHHSYCCGLHFHVLLLLLLLLLLLVSLLSLLYSLVLLSSCFVIHRCWGPCWENIRELKHATFLSHGRTPEVYCFPILLVFSLPHLYF